MSSVKTFNNFKIHTQYSICEGAIKIDDLANHCRENKTPNIGICDSFNLCGALEFAEKISKSGTHPITGTQINRSGYDSSEINMGNIAESAGLSHTADMMYGIIQDSSMHLNNEYWLKVLKIRKGSGKNSKCRYLINYDYMRLEETDEIVNSLI